MFSQVLHSLLALSIAVSTAVPFVRCELSGSVALAGACTARPGASPTARPAAASKRCGCCRGENASTMLLDSDLLDSEALLDSTTESAAAPSLASRPSSPSCCTRHSVDVTLPSKSKLAALFYDALSDWSLASPAPLPPYLAVEEPPHRDKRPAETSSTPPRSPLEGRRRVLLL